MIDMEGTHDKHDDEQSETWQTVGAVTAKLLLRLMEVDFKSPNDENLVDDQPRQNDLGPSHQTISHSKPHSPASGIAAPATAREGAEDVAAGASLGVAANW